MGLNVPGLLLKKIVFYHNILCVLIGNIIILELYEKRFRLVHAHALKKAKLESSYLKKI